MLNHWASVETFCDDNVTKFVFTKDGAIAETVLYRYPDYKTRTVICCSVQSGCPVGCTFCGTGSQFVKNLTADEIIEQVSYAVGQTGVDPVDIGRFQIMFMSMGEPFLNYDRVQDTILSLNETYPNAALLLSTIGPKSTKYDEFFTLAARIDKIGLQFSVHESTDAARNGLIPFDAKLSLSQLAELGKSFLEKTGRKPFINYCAHTENTSGDDVARLAETFNPHIFNATVSVICEKNNGLPRVDDSGKELASAFASELVSAGFDVRVFDPAGQDTIGGGCGQLWFVQDWLKERNCH